MPFEIVRNDITQMDTDVIVNAANNELRMGGGVCGAIFSAAGARDLQKECDAIAPCETGCAVITGGGKLSAKYIIHTPGPIWNGGKNGEAELLRACYINSLKLAEEYNCESISFPLISAGIFGYPKDLALKTATAAITEFLLTSDMFVYLVLFDKSAFQSGGDLLDTVESYIDKNYIESHTSHKRVLPNIERDMAAFGALLSAPVTKAKMRAPAELDDITSSLDESFSQRLLRLIDERGKSDAEVYKRANIDRRLFSKIRNNKDYMPGKKTALALAVALELDMDETNDLLKRAGYALSRSWKFDVIIEYFITNSFYDIFTINETLFYFDQPLLGG